MIVATDRQGCGAFDSHLILAPCLMEVHAVEIFSYMLLHSPVSPLSERHKIHSAASANVIFATDRGNEPQ